MLGAALDLRAKLHHPSIGTIDRKRVLSQVIGISRLNQPKCYFFRDQLSFINQTVHASRLPLSVFVDKFIRIGRVAIRFVDWREAVVAVCRVEGVERFVERRTKWFVIIVYRGVKRTQLIDPDARMRIDEYDSIGLVRRRKFSSRKRALGKCFSPWQ